MTRAGCGRGVASSLANTRAMTGGATGGLSPGAGTTGAGTTGSGDGTIFTSGWQGYLGNPRLALSTMVRWEEGNAPDGWAQP